jgi:hypothetical protein
VFAHRVPELYVRGGTPIGAATTSSAAGS